MRHVEILDGTNWKTFLEAPTALLMLSKSDCDNCAKWTDELNAFLAGDPRFAQVRFGKLILNQRGLIDFKRAHPWIAEVDTLPFNVLFRDGEKIKEWAGGGVDRMVNRLERVTAEGDTSGDAAHGRADD